MPKDLARRAMAQLHSLLLFFSSLGPPSRDGLRRRDAIRPPTCDDDDGGGGIKSPAPSFSRRDIPGSQGSDLVVCSSVDSFPSIRPPTRFLSPFHVHARAEVLADQYEAYAGGGAGLPRRRWHERAKLRGEDEVLGGEDPRRHPRGQRFQDRPPSSYPPYPPGSPGPRQPAPSCGRPWRPRAVSSRLVACERSRALIASPLVTATL